MEMSRLSVNELKDIVHDMQYEHVNRRAKEIKFGKDTIKFSAEDGKHLRPNATKSVNVFKFQHKGIPYQAIVDASKSVMYYVHFDIEMDDGSTFAIDIVDH